MSEQTIDELVQERIKAIFSEIAEMVGNGEVPHITEDEAAGAPLGLFRAEQALLGAWRCVVEPTHIEDGMLYNLLQEFHTADPYQLITELYTDRAAILADHDALRVERNRIRTERNATSAQLIAARRERDETVAELEHDLDDLRAERDAARERTTEMRNTLQNTREQLDDARVVVAQVEEASAFLGEAAGTAAAERDHARAWAGAWKAAAKHFRFLFYNVKEELQITGEITARFRIERDEWRSAAEEAQDAQFRYRDADVSALVRAAELALKIIEVRMVDVLFPDDTNKLRAALRPFRRVRVPVVGELSAETTPAEWEALRERIGAEVVSDE